MDTSRKATTVDQRKKNISAVKGIIGDCFVDEDQSQFIYESHKEIDVDSIIRRSSVELHNYELKQGIVSLDVRQREINQNVVEKIAKTICAIANNGSSSVGKIIIGVADKDEDVRRIERVDKVVSRRVSQRSVVGVDREAAVLGISMEDYLSSLKDGVSNNLSESLAASLASSFDYNSYFGLGVIVLTVRGQASPSTYKGDVYFRDQDKTKKAGVAEILEVAKRFS